MVLQDPRKAKWLYKIVDQLDAVKEKADPIAALNTILDPLKDELSMLGQISQLVSQLPSVANSEKSSQIPSLANSAKASPNHSKISSPRRSKEEMFASVDVCVKGAGIFEKLDKVIESPGASKDASLRGGNCMSSPSASKNASLHEGTAFEPHLIPMAETVAPTVAEMSQDPSEFTATLSQDPTLSPDSARGLIQPGTVKACRASFSKPPAASQASPMAGPSPVKPSAVHM